MFRTLGLRHLPVVNKEFELVGIITRRTFLGNHQKHGPVSKKEYEMKVLKTFMQPQSDFALRQMAIEEEEVANAEADTLNDVIVDDQTEVEGECLLAMPTSTAVTIITAEDMLGKTGLTAL